MGAVKGEQEGGDTAAAENAGPAQSEIAADAGEQAFENVPVGDDVEGAKATRYVGICQCFWLSFHLLNFHIKCSNFN